MDTPTRNDPQSSNTGRISPLDSLDFLLGEWQAKSNPGEPSGGFTFVSQLQAHIIVRSNYADYPATNEQPASRHEDLMVLYCDENQTLRADYYDSEGHGIRYSGQVLENHQVIFTSLPTASSPSFRLRYQLEDNGDLSGAFEIAPPNQAGPFNPYLSWSAHKV